MTPTLADCDYSSLERRVLAHQKHALLMYLEGIRPRGKSVLPQLVPTTGSPTGRIGGNNYVLVGIDEAKDVDLNAWNNLKPEPSILRPGEVIIFGRSSGKSWSGQQLLLERRAAGRVAINKACQIFLASFKE